MSGRKNVLELYEIITAGDMSQATLTSLVTDIQFLDNVGIQFNFTGSPVGNFFVDVSADDANWSPLPLSPSPAATGSGGTIYLDLNQLSAPYVRARYTKTSGTGSLNAFITSKAI